MFQKLPDFYSSIEESNMHGRRKEQTNPRYSNFRQTHFTAGDIEQFEEFKSINNGDPCRPIPEIGTDNVYHDYDIKISELYRNLQASDVNNTFEYLFNKFKKCIYVKIQDNNLRVFLPFSKASFRNEWGDKIKPKYDSMEKFIDTVSNMENRQYRQEINPNQWEWVGNNCLVRYEYPVSEGDSSVSNMKNMLEELCASRKVPDIEFYVNRRDFPLLTNNYTEPYNYIFGDDFPLVSHRYEKYAPILTMCVSEKNADILMPTWEDWARVQSFENKFFPKKARKYMDNKFETNWNKKIPTAVFRGGSTGCGVTIETNPRLKAAAMSAEKRLGKDGTLLLDAGISSWNLRPRKLKNSEYLDTINIKSMPFTLSSEISPENQSKYKYILNIEGHVAAFRLSLELAMYSVILLVESKWKIWYSDKLVPYTHYVPIKGDLSDLYEKIEWCRANDDKCRQIALNARTFYDKYLNKNAILDYMAVLLCKTKKVMGRYIYNTMSTLDLQLIEEKSLICKYDYPSTEARLSDIDTFPKFSKRNYNLLKSIEWVYNFVASRKELKSFIKYEREIFKNSGGNVIRGKFIDFDIVTKITNSAIKKKEHIHEVFAGLSQLNELSKYVPNFMYVFGINLEKNKDVKIVTEYIRGISLQDYILRENFSFENLLFLMIQISLALEIAQKKCGFVHNDLKPWNVMLILLENPVTFDYQYTSVKFFNVTTKMIPVIIDYGKSHIIHNKMHYGIVNQYKTSTIQDIITLVVSCVNTLLKDNKNAAQKFRKEIITLCNFLSGTKYRKEVFENIEQVSEFISYAQKYAELISSDKGELENRTPSDFIKYIIEKFKGVYKFNNITSSERTNCELQFGNARLNFDYIMSKTVEKKMAAISSFYTRIRTCSLPRPSESIFAYYAAQKLYMSVFTVGEMLKKQTYIKLSESVLIDKQNTENFLINVYDSLFSEPIETNQEYVNTSELVPTLIQANYNNKTFLDSRLTKELCENAIILPESYNEMILLKEFIQEIIGTKGKYEVKDDMRQTYINLYKPILGTKSLNILTFQANTNTLLHVAKFLYHLNVDFLSDYHCESVNELKNHYKNIISICEK